MRGDFKGHDNGIIELAQITTDLQLDLLKRFSFEVPANRYNISIFLNPNVVTYLKLKVFSISKKQFSSKIYIRVCYNLLFEFGSSFPFPLPHSLHLWSFLI